MGVCPCNMSPESNSNREQEETSPIIALPGLRIPGTAAEALFRVSLACLRGNSEPQNLFGESQDSKSDSEEETGTPNILTAQRTI